MKAAESRLGYFFLADISGLTAYLVGVELEHAGDILNELLEYVTGQIKPLFVAHDYDIDSVFAWVDESKINQFATLYDMVESTYIGFKNRLQDMSRRITCTCAACRNVSSLDLKFMVDHGEYMISEIHGTQCLVGLAPDFVRNRHWKESVSKATSWRGYILITEKALSTLDQTADEFQSQKFLSDGTKLYGLNLEKRYSAMLQNRRVVVSPNEANSKFVLELSISPSVAWEWLNDPAKRNKWYPSLLKWNAFFRPGGLSGNGAINHCNHGVGMVVETVLDWRPYEYFTVEIRVTPGNLRVLETVRLEEIPNDRTRISTFLHFQNMRFMAKLIGYGTARFLESRMKYIDYLTSNG